MTTVKMMMMEMRAIVHVQVPVIHAVQVVLGGAVGGARFFTFLEDNPYLIFVTNATNIFV